MSKKVSETAEKFIEDYKDAIKLEKTYNETDEEKIKVHQVSGKVAFLYEKLRNAVDYQEEHLLRKIAIERILKRRLMTEKNELDAAKFLMYELIRARYLPNDKIPEKRIEEIKEIIEKYTLLINNAPETIKGNKVDNERLFDWITGIAACEIEEKIAPYKKENAIIEFAQKIVDEKLKVPEKLMSQEDKRIQIHIAVLRNLIKSDLSLIEYRLFKRKHPEWFFAPSEELIIKMANNIDLFIGSIEKQINDPLGENFSKFVKKNLAYFTILEDAIRKNVNNIDKIFSHHLHVEDAIKESCVKKYKEAKTKLKRAAIRSIIYIFMTKMVLALVLELPFDKYIIGHINYLALAINVLFPPLLMFLVVVTIKIPSKRNTELIVQGIKEMIYGKYASIPFVMKGILHRSSFFYKVFKFFYALVFFASFGIIIFILQKLNFNIMSIGLFLFFLSVVSYFGIRIRQSARELVVTKRKEGIITFATDLFSIPILRMGQWLSTKLSNINVFVFIFDFIIEAPFKTFVEVFEEWIYYIKEEREKIY
ncbi:MAG: hypothetical protein KAQ64_00715 [Candidatus Pacebacteria bacterium]|nr:hypothetical protein [Candidatus Paceibacterota bacterium]